MTVLPQLKADLQDAAGQTLTQPRPSRLPMLLSVAVSVGVLVIVFISVHAGPQPLRRGSAAGPAHARTNAPTGKRLAGTGPGCAVTLANTPSAGEVAPPKADESRFQLQMLDRGTATWPVATTTTRFDTCPPKRALVVGDSIAFTIAEPYLYNEQDYGIAISDAATLGCAFGVRGELDVNGTWEAPPSGCPDELSRWARQADAFGAQEIIVELGSRDEFDWRWKGTVEHLGEAGYDAYVESRIRDFIDVLGEDGKRKLLFLSVPFTSPPAEPGDQASPAGSTTRHAEINQLIARAVKSDGAQAEVLDIDTVLSPGHSYATDVNGERCRFRGSHVTTYCAALLEPDVLGAARELLGGG